VSERDEKWRKPPRLEFGEKLKAIVARISGGADAGRGPFFTNRAWRRGAMGSPPARPWGSRARREGRQTLDFRRRK
jgi:hypothetical protein